MQTGLEFAIVLTGVVTALMQLVKGADFISSRYLPLVSLTLGFIIGMVAGLDWLLAIMIGLSASGVYDLGKKTIRNK